MQQRIVVCSKEVLFAGHNLIGNSPGPIPIDLVITREILSLPLENGFSHHHLKINSFFLEIISYERYHLSATFSC